MKLVELADYFAKVIIHYHNVIIEKYEKDETKKQSLLIQKDDIPAFLKRDDVLKQLVDRCEMVNRYRNSREEHLRFFRTVFEELSRYNKGVDEYVNDILDLHHRKQHEEKAKKQRQFIKCCNLLKKDLIHILAGLYRLNHESYNQTFKIAEKTFTLASTAPGVWSLYQLSDMRDSIRDELLTHVGLRTVKERIDARLTTPEELAKETLEKLLSGVNADIDRSLGEKWERDAKPGALCKSHSFLLFKADGEKLREDILEETPPAIKKQAGWGSWLGYST